MAGANADSETNSAADGASATDRALEHHGFHSLSVAEVIPETHDTCSLVLDIPDDLRDAFSYEAGQFCTFRVQMNGEHPMRCYSMSSSPAVDQEFRVTIKRVPGGLVSNHLNDNVAAGDVLDVTRPAGVFQLGEGTGEIVAVAGGSGITPVISIIKEALATTDRRIRLLYANRDSDSTIFSAGLASIEAEHPDRLEVVYHHDAETGFLDVDAVKAFAGELAGADGYVCGPTVFMDIAEEALLGSGLDPSKLHIERFSTPPPPPAAPLPADEAITDPGAADSGAGESSGPALITIELDGRTETTTHQAGTTILQAARQADLKPPSSCESGSCATCMAKVIEGAVEMHTNNALTEEEVDEGWILTCQSVPTETPIHVIYGFD
jgi:ferredoxin-NADP reductase